MAENQTKQKSKAAELCEKVAAKVDIVEVRLVETNAKQKLINGNYPPKINVGRRASTRRDNESNHILVTVSFIFEAKDPENQDGSSLQIAATYDLAYKLENLQTYADDEIEAFGKLNGCYNAWPFWREYVYSTLARMGLPPVTMPVFRYDEEEPEPTTEDKPAQAQEEPASEEKK